MHLVNGIQILGGGGTSYDDGEQVTNLLGANHQPVTLYAQWVDETNIAEVVGVGKYSTLHDAIAAAESLSGHQTVRLLNNVEVTTTVTISQSKDITLDLQNYTLKNQNGSDINIIKNNGTLEIVGGANGTITTNSGYGAVDNEIRGHLTVSSGNIIATGTKQAIYNAGGKVEVKGTAYLESSAADRATIQNFKPTDKNAGTITISGGTIVSKSTTTKGAVQNEETGTVIVTGGTIISENNMGIDNAATLIIGTEDDDVDVTTPTIQGANYGVQTTGLGTVEFYNGTVKGKTHAFNDENSITAWELVSDITHSTETIDGDTYEIAFLEIVRLRVTFNANGGTMDGTNEEDSILVNIGSSIGSANLPTPTRDYKNFIGWYTDPDPSSGTQIDGTESITQNVTYYAHWTALMVTVNFDPTSGTIPQIDASKTVEAGDPVGALPTTATSVNEYFAGWYTDPTNGTRIDENEIIGDTTVTFYAHWISNPVARIGVIHYESLQEAIDDVPADNTQTTITLMQTDLEAVSILDTNKNIILDLNGYTLYNNGSANAIGMDNGQTRPSVIENLGTLKIMNGIITTNSSQAAINTGTGDVIIEDVTIRHTGTSGKNVKQAIYVYSGTVLITGNSVISANNTGEYGGYKRGAIQIAGGTLTITGGTVTSSAGPAIVNQAGGTLILGEEDGTANNSAPVIQGKTNGIETNAAGTTFNFYDGIVKGITNSIYGSVADYEDGASRIDSTETIGTDTYNTTYYQ